MYGLQRHRRVTPYFFFNITLSHKDDCSVWHNHCCYLIRRTHQGSHGPPKTGKGPEFEILFPAVKKPGISVLSRENKLVTGKIEFRSFVPQLKVLVTETQAFVRCLFSRNVQSFRVSTRKFWTQRVPVSSQSKQRLELTDGHPSLFRTCAQSCNAAATKIQGTWKLWS